MIIFATMDVVVKKDSSDIFPFLFEGSVIRDVKKHGKNYVGMFNSFVGSYEVEIPKNRVKKYKPENTIFTTFLKFKK